jgi:peptidoglycan/xylan/chitin deacetylase (PgdA/CDA1 family)
MANRLPILTFHALDDRPSAISFSPGLFQRGMALLRETGYRTLSLEQAANLLRRGAPFPDLSVVITFDDGYRTVYDEAFPILKQHDMLATVFLAVGENRAMKPADQLPSLSGRSMLDWRQIREMHGCGIGFGAHTLSHPDMTRLAPDRMEAEARDSKAIIEDTLGAAVTCFAYPYGRYDEQSRNVVRQHFACACSDRLGFCTAGSDPYAIERIDAYYLRSERMFALMSTGWFPWYIRARSIPRCIRRAVQNIPRK